jgi:hypothetical protein
MQHLINRCIKHHATILGGKESVVEQHIHVVALVDKTTHATSSAHRSPWDSRGTPQAAGLADPRKNKNSALQMFEMMDERV